MLYVKTEVRPSLIQGLGVFAAEPIAAGTLVSRWDERFDRSYSREQWLAFPPQARDFVWRYGWRGLDGRMRVLTDNSRYVNHSTDPTMRVVFDEEVSSYAVRDIVAGEELTEDYSTFDPDFAEYAHEFGVAAGHAEPRATAGSSNGSNGVMRSGCPSP